MSLDILLSAFLIMMMSEIRVTTRPKMNSLLLSGCYNDNFEFLIFSVRRLQKCNCLHVFTFRKIFYDHMGSMSPQDRTDDSDSDSDSGNTGSKIPNGERLSLQVEEGVYKYLSRGRGI